jgi:hypothetical protein
VAGAKWLTVPGVAARSNGFSGMVAAVNGVKMLAVGLTWG